MPIKFAFATKPPPPLPRHETKIDITSKITKKSKHIIFRNSQQFINYNDQRKTCLQGFVSSICV